MAAANLCIGGYNHQTCPIHTPTTVEMYDFRNQLVTIMEVFNRLTYLGPELGLLL